MAPNEMQKLAEERYPHADADSAYDIEKARNHFIAGLQHNNEQIEAKERECERLRSSIERIAHNWHVVFYRATSTMTAREIEDLWKERLPDFRKQYERTESDFNSQQNEGV